MRILQRLLARLRRDPLPSGAFTLIEGPGGAKMLVDQVTLEYMRSTGPDPNQDSLDAVLDQTQSVCVFEGGAVSGEPLEKDKLLFEIDNEGSLAKLRQSLRIMDGSGGHCMCHGEPTIELLGASRERLAVIASHHGVGIRWNEWHHDAKLVDGRSLLEWFAEHGVPEPLNQYNDSLQRANQAREAWSSWLEAMPPCLAKFAGQMEGGISWARFEPEPDVDGDSLTTELSEKSKESDSFSAALNALEDVYPDEVERALALFEWFGSGKGPWSGFPSYETAPEAMLMILPIEVLLDALERAEPTERQLEGAARFLGGWDFRKKRGKEMARISDSIRQKLLDHCERSDDADKRHRAKRAFGL